MGTSSCVLCGGSGPLDRRCGLDVCETCALGQLDAGVQRWGLTLDQRRWTEQTGSSESRRTVECLEVRVDFPTPLLARASFQREGGLDRLVQWFRGADLQGGDPLFDRAVIVLEPEGPHLPGLIRDEGLQGAILELVAGGGVRLGDNWVRARRASSLEYPAFDEVAVPLVLLAVHLETYARLQPRTSD